MGKKMSLKRYRVYSKRYDREYSIIVFDEEYYLVPYDYYHESGRCEVDGDEHAFKSLSIAMAILAQDPNVIIYFPVNHPEFSWDIYTHLVLTRCEMDLSHKEWTYLRSKLSRYHLKDKYHFTYNKKLLMDSYEAIKDKKYYTESYWYNKNAFRDKMIDQTMFIKLNRYLCLEFHSKAVEGLRAASSNNGGNAEPSGIGWLFPRRFIPGFYGDL